MPIYRLMTTSITPTLPTPIIEVMTEVQAPIFTRAFLRTIGQALQQAVRLPRNSSITLRIVGDRRMRQLNQRYRTVPEVTDVLSFGYDRSTADIVICYPQAQRQAKAKQHPLRRECAWLVIHGMLHWLGYDHEAAADAKVMRPLEQDILRYGQF